MNDEADELIVDKYRDLIFILNNGTRLISRLLENVEDEDGNLIDDTHYFYEPHELVRLNDGRLIMTKWIPETTDLIVPIPVLEVMTSVNPDDDLLKYYLQQIGVIPKDDERMISKAIH